MSLNWFYLMILASTSLRVGFVHSSVSNLNDLTLMGRVFIGASETVKRLTAANDSYYPPDIIAPGATYFAHRKYDDWRLVVDAKNAGELHDLLNMLYQRGARRFVLFTEMRGSLRKDQYHLPMLMQSRVPFLAVNHSESFTWKGAKFSRAQVSFINDQIRVFKNFAETHAVMETSAIAASDLSSGVDDLVRVALDGPSMTDPNTFPPSYDPCTQYGACVGDEVLAISGGEVVQGKVALIGFRGAKKKDEVMLGVALRNQKTGGLEWHSPGDVAESTPGICRPMLSPYCVNAEVAVGLESDVHARIKGVFSDSDRVILEQAGKYQIAERGSLKPLTPLPILPKLMSGQVKTILPREDLSLRELLVEWVPREIKRKGEFLNPWAACSEPRLQDHPQPLTADGTPVNACVADTLYYWGEPAYVDSLKERSRARDWRQLIDGDPGLYLVTSPASTFGYGSVDGSGGLAVRIKLRPGVKYKLTHYDPSVFEPVPFRAVTVDTVEIRQLNRPGCSQFPANEVHDTVYLRYWSYREPPRKEHPKGVHDGGLEYVICSMNVIESWSYGTRDFYDEFVRDTRRFVEGWDLPGAPSYIRRRESDGKTRPILFGIVTDHRPFTQRHLIQALKLQLDLAATGRGQVFLNPHGGNSKELRRRHFKTATPSWFNPR